MTLIMGGSIQLLHLHFQGDGDGGPSRCKCKQKKRVKCHDNARIKLFSIKYLVHKLLATVARFFFSFVKIPVLLNLSVVRK